MQIRYRALVLAMAASVAPIACGGGNHAAPPKTPTSIATGSQPVSQPEAASFDLSPVAAPSDVVLRARMAVTPKQLQQISGWIGGQPLPVEEMTHDIFNIRGLGQAVALDAPVDVIVAFNDDKGPRAKPSLAFSVGIKSYDQTKDLLVDRTDPDAEGSGQYPNGVIPVKLGSRHDKLWCVLSPSVGVSQARLVCAPKRKHVAFLYPYMTRTLPNETFSQGQTIYAQLDMAPLHRRFGGQLPAIVRMGLTMASREVQTGNSNLDAALSDALQGTGDEAISLFNDLDKLTIGGKLDTDAHNMRGFLSLSFKGQDSWTALKLNDAATQAGHAPDIFWKLPKDSEMAIFYRPNPGKHNEKLKSVLGTLIEAGLASQKFPRSVGKKAASVVNQFLEPHPASVVATGHAKNKPGASKLDRHSYEGMRAAIISSLGWELVGIDEGPKRTEKTLRDLASLYNNPSVQRWAKKMLKKEADMKLTRLPTLRFAAKRAKGLPGLKALTISFSPTTLPKDMRKHVLNGSKHPKPIEYHVLIWPHDGKTWLAVGADATLLESKLRIVAAGKADETLQSRAGLGDYRRGTSVASGYMTMAGLFSQVGNNLSDNLKGTPKDQHVQKMMKQILSAMPHRGTTPMLFGSNISHQGGGLTYTLHADMPKGAFDDVLTVVRLVAAMSH